MSTLQIKKMAEIVSQEGVQIYEMIYNPETGMTENKARKSYEAERIFWRAFDKNIPFCFSPIHEIPTVVAENDNILADYKQFDIPFSVFSIEVSNQMITVSNDPKAPIGIGCIMVCDRMETSNDFDKLKPIMLFILYYYQNVPYVFLEFISSDQMTDDGQHLKLFKIDNFDVNKDATFAFHNIHTHIISEFTERLNKESTVGNEDVNINIHYKGKHNKRQKTQIRRIVHIVPKSARKLNHSISGKEVEWTHRFWRRGTWVNFYKEDGSVDFNKVGKNRDGEYCEYGRTWRIESIVNQYLEHLPLINKTRVVKE